MGHGIGEASRIAVIGAGMAGLAAARRLADAGRSVTVFDKSRGVGGRMSTRRLDGLTFDHGAQYFRTRGAAFKRHVATWLAEGHAATWADDMIVGIPGMTGPARALAQGLTIVPGVTVMALARTAQGWLLKPAEAPAAEGPFSSVVLAVPSPQALPLLASADVAFPRVADAGYAPCWALMLAFDGREPIPDRQAPEDVAISWIARNGSKPGRDPKLETVVVHAAADWTRAHLENTPDQVAPLLLERYRRLTGSTAAPRMMTAHRWRYALVERPAGEPFFFDTDRGLGACGDWCIGGRIEAAFDSGHLLAGALLDG